MLHSVDPVPPSMNRRRAVESPEVIDPCLGQPQIFFLSPTEDLQCPHKYIKTICRNVEPAPHIHMNSRKKNQPDPSTINKDSRKIRSMNG